MGTLRFGDDPAQSVCDRDGRFHDLDNLYAADGALFPTSSGFNPILTITAVGGWVGASMIDPPRPAAALRTGLPSAPPAEPVTSSGRP
jgi:choline dehydrogenase-like flavoprotein